MKNILIILFLFLFLFLFLINVNSCKIIREHFEEDISGIIDTNKDSIDNIKKKLGLIHINTDNILKKSNQLLFKSQSDNKNYNDLSKKSNKKLKNEKEIEYDINKLNIFKLLQNLDKKDLFSVMETVQTNMTDSQKQILDEYVNVSISNNSINKSLQNLNSK